MMANPISPTPKKAVRRGTRAPRPRGPGASTSARSTTITGKEEDWEEVGGTGDEELFDLLGVVSPPPLIDSGIVSGHADSGDAAGSSRRQEQGRGKRGVLSVSKADIEASTSASTSKPKGGRRNPRRGNAGQDERLGVSGPGGPDTERVREKREPRNRGKKKDASSAAAQIPISLDSTTQSESDTPIPPNPESGTSTPKSRRQPKPTSRRSATKVQAQPVSALSAQLASHPSPSKLGPYPSFSHHGTTMTTTSSTHSAPFDLSSLSRSLPSESVFAASPRRPIPQTDEFGAMPEPKGSRKGKGRRKGIESEDESKVWDAPYDAGPAVAEDMTWQQRLGSYPYADPPSRSSPQSSSNSLNKKKSRPVPTPSPLNPSLPTSASTSLATSRTSRPTHARRSSADTLPLPSHARHTSLPTGPSPHPPKPPPSAYPLSTFDTLPPFNPAQNVHRAPQTPAKGGLAAKYAVMELPIKQGAFPRLNGYSSTGGMGGSAGSAGMTHMGSLEGGKYAGASFHNSPHGRALPKPDLEDF